MRATSGSNPVKMTSLQYGTNVSHVIRGVPVSGGSCTVGPVEADASPADYEITSAFTFTPSSERTYLQGGDISRLNMELDHGVTYKVGGAATDLVDLAVENGWNWVRIRVFNDPGNSSYVPSKYMTAGYVNKADAVALAKKAKDAGMQVMLSFHYSDYWTDPLIQNVPHAWTGYTESQLQTAVADFTTEVLEAMAAQSALPDYVSLGNEVNSGMFFGGNADHTGYDNTYRYNRTAYAGFFKSGAAAVKAVSSSIKTVVHLTNPFTSSVEQMLDAMNSASASYDIIGLSYYPYWTEKTVGEFVTRAGSLSSSYNKDIVIMETGFNWNTVTYYNDAGQLVDNRPYESIYPASEENQRNYLQELSNGVKGSDRIIGFLYWDPLTVKLNTWSGMNYMEGGTSHSNHDNGTVTQNSALFDFEGNRLDAWDAFKYNN